MAEAAVTGLGAIVGLLLGLTGAGGSVIAVPLLMFGLGWSLPQAVPVALLAVAVSAVVGAASAARGRLVCYRAGLLMAVLGLVTAPIGIYLAQWLPVFWLQLLFTCVLLIVAARMYMQALYAPADSRVVRAAIDWSDSSPVCRFNADTGRLSWSSPCALALTISGALTGMLAGLIGVGGGFIIVPALRQMTQLTMHAAVGTSLLAIALISTAGFSGAIVQGVDVAATTAIPFVAGSIAGMAAGRGLAPFLAGPLLQKGFAIVMVFVAAGLGTQLILD